MTTPPPRGRGNGVGDLRQGQPAPLKTSTMKSQAAALDQIADLALRVEAHLKGAWGPWGSEDQHSQVTHTMARKYIDKILTIVRQQQVAETLSRGIR